MALAIEVPAAGGLERLGDAAEREVVGLGAAAREDDLGRLGRRSGRRRLSRASSSAALAC